MKNHIVKFMLLLILLIALTNKTKAQTIWSQIGNDIDGEAAGDQSGGSVSMSADGLTVAIGAILNNGNGSTSGHVRVYKFITGSWVQQGLDIDGEAPVDRSGGSVSISDDGLTVAIGANLNDGNGVDAGHVRVYKLITGTWTQQGLDIDGEVVGDASGGSVSMSADGLTVAIGAVLNDGNGSTSGHVRVYKFITGAWVQQGLDIDGEAANDASGGSVSMSADGLTVAIGAPQNDGNGSFAGHVRVYKLTTGAWVQQGLDIDGEAANDLSGNSVSMSADGLTVAIGGRQNDGNGVDAGHVRVYKFITGTWVQQGVDIDGEALGDISGYSVSMSADGLKVAIGAVLNDGNGANAGHVRVYKFCPISNSSFSVTECLSYTVPSGDETYTVAGIYTQMDTVPNSCNNDSIMTINITIVGTLTGIVTNTICANGSVTVNGTVYNATTPTGTEVFTNVGPNNCDSTVTVNLNVLPVKTGSVTNTICANGSVTVNGTVYNAATPTGTEIFTNIGPNNCDSTVSVNLTVLSAIDTSTSLLGLTIAANQSGATYQWIDCNNGNSALVGQTSVSYTATTNGSYAVVITVGACSDTSACINITGVGVIENTLEDKFVVYPNPTSGIITIKGDNIKEVELINIKGQKIRTIVVENEQLDINLSKHAKGSYLINIVTNEGVIVKKVVVE